MRLIAITLCLALAAVSAARAADAPPAAPDDLDALSIADKAATMTRPVALTSIIPCSPARRTANGTGSIRPGGIHVRPS